VGNPASGILQALGEQLYIETQRVGAQIENLFLWRQEVKEQRANSGSANNLCHILVTRAITAAAATVREEHDAAGIYRKVDVSF